MYLSRTEMFKHQFVYYFILKSECKSDEDF